MAGSKIPVAVVGATGLAGQQFLVALADHPLFEVTRIAASARSAGKKLADALKNPNGSSRWGSEGTLAPRFAELVVADAQELDVTGLGAVFTAVESDAAKVLEPLYAKHVPVFSTASAFRYEDDVPILLPAVNPAHAELIARQQSNRDWKGYVAPGPNCTTIGLVHALAPLAEAFGLKGVTMTSMQAVSGAGRTPGVAAMDIVDNIIPYIPKEEEKVALETRKVLGRDESLAMACLCTRVPVIEGHTEAVFAQLDKPFTVESAAAAFRNFCTDRDDLKSLPSAPDQWIIVHDDPFRPQPRLDRNNEKGMATTLGRLGIADGNTLKFMLVSHNTQMGAAKGSVLTAEWMQQKGQL